MKRSEHRILTTHVGSIPRPQDLLEASGGGANTGRGPSDWKRYEEILRRSIAEVVKQQAAAGIDIVNDGEFGKSSWAGYILERLSGFEVRPDQLRPIEWLGRDRERFADFIAEEMPRVKTGSPTEACIGPVDIPRPPPARPGAGCAQGGVRRREGGGVLHDRGRAGEHGLRRRQRVLPHRARLHLRDRRRAARGIPRDPQGRLPACRSTMRCWRTCTTTLVQKSPEHYRKWAELRVEALNHALEGIPEDRIRYHVCFGSWHVPHIADAPLEDIIDIVLQVKTGAYSIEAANPRHEHEWRVWEKRKLPNNRILIPGVITHHIVTVEHPRLIADRIVRFAKLVGRENVIAGTDCGFAQVDFIKRVHASVMWAKFEALAEGARIASKELWGR